MSDIFYYSNKSKPCTVILQQLETMPHIRSKFQYVSIDQTQPRHPIRSVPAVIVEGQKMEGKQVFEWLEKEKHNNTLPPFEVGFGTNNFTSIHNDSAAAENNHNFTYIDSSDELLHGTTGEQPRQNPQNEAKSGGKTQKIKDSALDDLISARKMDIPIPRGRA